MADVFISYAKEDRVWVKNLAEAIEAEGLSVWWDPELLPGSMYREAISTELASAKAIVVVWSHRSIVSDYVRDEAEDGRKAHKLVPVLRDPVEPPHGFRQIQTADLSQWLQHRENSQFRLLMKGIGAFTGRTAAANAAAAHPVEIHVPTTAILRHFENLRAWTRKPAFFAAGGVIAVALLAIIFWPRAGSTQQPGQLPPVAQNAAAPPSDNGVVQSAPAPDAPAPETSNTESSPAPDTSLPAEDSRPAAPLTTQPQEPSPPQTDQQAAPSPSFTCSKASLSDEFIICGSTELAALDVEVHNAYAALGGPHHSAASVHKFMQDQLKRRHGCANADCIHGVLQDELEFLSDQ